MKKSYCSLNTRFIPGLKEYELPARIVALIAAAWRWLVAACAAPWLADGDFWTISATSLLAGTLVGLKFLN